MLSLWHDTSLVHTICNAHCFNKSLLDVTCATSPHADWSKWHNVECQVSVHTKHWNQINHLAWSARGAVPEQANNTFFSPLSLLFPGPLSPHREQDKSMWSYGCHLRRHFCSKGWKMRGSVGLKLTIKVAGFFSAPEGWIKALKWAMN